MKRITTILLLGICLNISAAKEYKKIKIGLTTTIHLLFPSDIVKYDIGLGQVGEYPDILTDQSSSNRLKMAAGIKEFQTTNLFVETEEAYYNFIIEYEEFPEKHFVPILKTDAESIKELSTSSTKNNEEEITSEESHYKVICTNIYKKPETSFISANNTLGILFQLDNIYVKNDKLFMKFTVRNDSNIKYEVGYLGYVITRKGKGKKQGVVTDDRLTPLYTYQEFSNLQANEEKNIISVFDKFTLEKGKHLVINIWERDGERMVEIKIKPNQLIKAKILK